MQNLKVDAYINKTRAFAQPILTHIRQLVHTVCEETDETLKWSFPHFIYKGKSLCYMAAFKEHCTFGFWLGAYIEDTHGLFVTEGKNKAMGQFGHIREITDLPESSILAQYIIQAMQLTEAGIQIPKTANAKPAHIANLELQAALNAHPDALAFFITLTQSAQNEYISWVNAAKRDETRARRILQSIEQLRQGKKRDWKYQR